VLGCDYADSDAAENGVLKGAELVYNVLQKTAYTFVHALK
jgi:hypothetical protein